jgi:hypothetical protein
LAKFRSTVITGESGLGTLFITETQWSYKIAEIWILPSTSLLLQHPKNIDIAYRVLFLQGLMWSVGADAPESLTKPSRWREKARIRFLRGVSRGEPDF